MDKILSIDVKRILQLNYCNADILGLKYNMDDRAWDDEQHIWWACMKLLHHIMFIDKVKKINTTLDYFYSLNPRKCSKFYEEVGSINDVIDLMGVYNKIERLGYVNVEPIISFRYISKKVYDFFDGRSRLSVCIHKNINPDLVCNMTFRCEDDYAEFLKLDEFPHVNIQNLRWFFSEYFLNLNNNQQEVLIHLFKTRILIPYGIHFYD